MSAAHFTSRTNVPCISFRMMRYLCVFCSLEIYRQAQAHVKREFEWTSEGKIIAKKCFFIPVFFYSAAKQVKWKFLHCKKWMSDRDENQRMLSHAYCVHPITHMQPHEILLIYEPTILTSSKSIQKNKWLCCIERAASVQKKWSENVYNCTVCRDCRFVCDIQTNTQWPCAQFHSAHLQHVREMNQKVDRDCLRYRLRADKKAFRCPVYCAADSRTERLTAK